MARDITIQVRMTEDEAVKLHSIGERLSRKHSDVRKPDGSINLSATVRRMIANA